MDIYTVCFTNTKADSSVVLKDLGHGELTVIEDWIETVHADYERFTQRKEGVLDALLRREERRDRKEIADLANGAEIESVERKKTVTIDTEIVIKKRKSADQ